MLIEQLAKQYESITGPIIHKAAAPTAESVAMIEGKLGCQLPRSLIQFASAAPNYGNWLASIGPDYASATHILTLNAESYIQGKPENFVIINVGYDEDFECIDTQTFIEETGEYLITYWSPGVPLRESDLYENFQQCMEKNVQFWKQNT